MPRHSKTKRARAQKKSERKPSAVLARSILGVAPTKTDNDLARQLAALYRNKQTPEFIRHTIFQLFWDSCEHYKIPLPPNFTKAWLPYWALILAAHRRTGNMPARIRYTWHPTEEETAELDAQEKAETTTRAIFDACHNREIPPDIRGRFADGVIEVLDLAHPYKNWEVFRTAWPRALRILNEDDGAQDTERGEENQQIELAQDAAAIARILNSNHIPENVHNALAEAIQEHISNLNDDAEAIKRQWPLAAQKYNRGSI